MFAIIVGIAVWQVWRDYQQGQINAVLIAAIERNDTAAALAALRSHADPKCRAADDAPPTLLQYLQALWQRTLGHAPPPLSEAPVALTLAVE